LSSVIGPPGPPTAVQGKLYQVSHRWEVGVASLALMPRIRYVF